MAVPDRVSRFLDSHHVRYTIDHHAPRYSAQQLAAEEGTTGYHVAKVVICLADEMPVLLVLPAPFIVDLETLGYELGSLNVHLAEAKEVLARFFDGKLETPPAPLPIWEGVRIHVDTNLLAGSEITFASGSARDAIRMRLEDWLLIAHPSVGRFARAQPDACHTTLVATIVETSCL